MGNIAPQDISKQVPSWSILTSAYLFRDADHLNKFCPSDLGAQFKKQVEDQVKVRILGADLLRHAPGRPQAEEEDQHARRPGRRQAAHAAGRRLAAARPLARRQPDADGLRRDLHRPADRRDRRPGQPAAQRAEHEVLRGDVADRADLAPGRLRPADRQPEDLERHGARRSRSAFQAAADKAIAWSAAEHQKREAGAGRRLPQAGPARSTRPDVNAFRAHAQKVYLASDEAKEWPKGMLEKINAIK